VILTAGLAAKVETGADDAEVPQSFQRSSVDVLVFPCAFRKLENAEVQAGWP